MNESINTPDFSGCEIKTAKPATRYAVSRAINSNLVETASGLAFDGVLQDATIGMNAVGHIFGATPRFESGAFIETSDIVNVGHVPANGYYIETLNHSRYLVASIEFCGNLPESTSSVEAAIKNKRKHLDYNKAYYSALQWSYRRDFSDSFHSVITALIAKIRNLHVGQELVCNSFGLLGYDVDYAEWAEAHRRLRDAGVLECRRVPNGFCGWDYADYLVGPDKLDQVTMG